MVDDDLSFRNFVRLVGTIGLKTISLLRPKVSGSTTPDGLLVWCSMYRCGAERIDLQRLTQSDRSLPIIFTTGHEDIPMTVEAMKAVIFSPSLFVIRK